MKFKILFLFFFAIIISSNLVEAEINVQRGYEWLINQSNNGSFNNNIIDTSFALLALNNINRVDEIERAANYLETQISPDGCFPRGNCRVKDTALAIIALNEINRNIENSRDWLTRAQTASLLNGNWYFQIVTTDTGSCRFTYSRNNNEVVRNVTVIQGRFPDCSNSTWLNINTCLEQGLVNSYASLLIDVDCRNLDNAIISLLYSNANSYYILDEVHNKQAAIRIENGCYGRTFRAACTYEDTLYADLALNKLNSDVNSRFYLDLNYDSASVLHNSLLHLITGRDLYLDALRERQRRDGSFDNNIFNTALAVLASRDRLQDVVENATNWLGLRQQEDGSWQTVANTALVLYASQGEVLEEICAPGETRLCEVQEGVCRGSSETCVNRQWSGCNYATINNFELIETRCNDNLDNDCDNDIDRNDADCTRPICNLNGVCNDDLGENINNCPEDCLTSTICNNDGVCDFDLGEDVDNCPEDCETEQDTCNNGIRDDDEDGIDCGGVCPNDCPSIRAECNNDGICELQFGENAVDCTRDCSCGDNVCDTSEDRISCPNDCGGVEKPGVREPPEVPLEAPAKKRFPFWIFGLLFIIFLGAYIYYKKFIRKPKQEFGFGGYSKGAGKESKPRFKLPFISFRKKKSELEKEIDKSIEEAQELIKK